MSTVGNTESSRPDILSRSVYSKECQENSGYGFFPGETEISKTKQEKKKKKEMRKSSFSIKWRLPGQPWGVNQVKRKRHEVSFNSSAQSKSEEGILPWDG